MQIIISHHDFRLHQLSRRLLDHSHCHQDQGTSSAESAHYVQRKRAMFDSGEASLIMTLLFSRPRPVGGDSSPPGFHPDTLAPPPPKEDQLVIGKANGYQLICLEDGQQDSQFWGQRKCKCLVQI